ncbi:hypothetical protein IGJ28_003466 [Enterococcus sp. AZ091]
MNSFEKKVLFFTQLTNIFLILILIVLTQFQLSNIVYWIILFAICSNGYLLTEQIKKKLNQ